MKNIIHIFPNFLVISSENVNLIHVTASWPETEVTPTHLRFGWLLCVSCLFVFFFSWVHFIVQVYHTFYKLVATAGPRTTIKKKKNKQERDQGADLPQDHPAAGSYVTSALQDVRSQSKTRAPAQGEVKIPGLFFHLLPTNALAQNSPKVCDVQFVQRRL